MSFTYAQLKQAIQDYCENNETTFVNNLPLFIRNAEEKILKSMQLSVFKKNVTGNLTSGNKYLAAPGDFLSPMSLSFTDAEGDERFLLFKDTDFVQTFNPDGSETGRPRFYAQFDISNFIVGPTPDSNYNVELHYFYRPASLTSGAEDSITWLSENATLAMLYGSLVEAYTFMKGEPDMVQLYLQSFTNAMTGLKMFGESKEVIDEYRAGKVIRQRQ